jgi:hypothetical protein
MGCATSATYPCGPYDTMANTVIANLTLPGQHDDNGNGTPTDDAWHDLHFSDYYAARAQGLKAFVVLVSAEWCVPCKMEQSGLVTLFDMYQAGGHVAFLESVVQNSMSQPADQTVVDAWATTYKIPFDMAGDPNQVLMPYYSLSTFPMQMVIRVSDMQIIYKHNGISTISEMQAQIDALLQ